MLIAAAAIAAAQPATPAPPAPASQAPKHEMRRSLEHLAASCHGDNRPDCPILGGLEGADQ
jgi:hypothetical protein